MELVLSPTTLSLQWDRMSRKVESKSFLQIESRTDLHLTTIQCD